MSVVDGIVERLARDGRRRYGGEAVSQLQHALQCAVLGERAGAPDTLVVAALLHDYGHLIADDEGAAARGVDLRHEEVAAQHLAPWFPAAVTEPIRLHVAAKQYLCAVDPAYFDSLSPASVMSLNVQGGPMGDDAVRTFRRTPFWQEAVRLRAWDDLAKDPEMTTPGIDAYRATIARVRRGAGACA